MTPHVCPIPDHRTCLVFVSGPFRAQSNWGITQNIRAAEQAALDIWSAGFTAICPHLNTANFQGALPDHVWLEGDLEMLRRCDAMYLLPTWQQSLGAIQEYHEARRCCIPVFTSIEKLQEWYAAS